MSHPRHQQLRTIGYFTLIAMAVILWRLRAFDSPKNETEQKLIGDWIVLTTDMPKPIKDMHLTLSGDHHFVVVYFNAPNEPLASRAGNGVDSYGTWWTDGETLLLRHDVSDEGVPNSLFETARNFVQSTRDLDTFDLKFDGDDRIVAKDPTMPPEAPWHTTWSRISQNP